MPIVQDSVPMNYPANDYVVVRYMDLPKFLSLIHKRAMFFCRLDALGDKFEGQTAKKNYEWRIGSFRRVNELNFLNTPMSESEILDSVSRKYVLEKKLKSIRLVSCWNKREEESAALWKIYSENGKGLLIKSTINRIKKAFRLNEEEIRISEIKYINYDKDLMPDNNDYYPAIHKQDAYSYEVEVKLLHEIIKGVTDGEYDWGKEENPDGKYFDLNLDDLIEEIMVGPYCPTWQYDLIKDILNKYNVDKEIKKSRLTV